MDKVQEGIYETVTTFGREFVDTTRLEARDALALIVAARDLNPDALIPTALWVAIEAGRRIL